MVNKELVINKVVISLFENAGKLSHGTVSATLTVHEGRVVTVCHEIKEVVRKREEVQNECSV
jgi:hypothetical protein